MGIVIDTTKDEVLTDIEISNRAGLLISERYSKERELKLMRMYLASPEDSDIKAAFLEYNTFVEEVRADSAFAKCEAGKLRSVLSAEATQDVSMLTLEEHTLFELRAANRAVLQDAILKDIPAVELPAVPEVL